MQDYAVIVLEEQNQDHLGTVLVPAPKLKEAAQHLHDFCITDPDSAVHALNEIGIYAYHAPNIFVDGIGDLGEDDED